MFGEDELNEITVDMNMCENAAAPQFLRTDGLGPCIGIGLIDLDTQHGYLVHAAAPAACDSADEFFGTIQGCSQNVKILVAGGDAEKDASGETEVGKDRDYVLRRLGEIFPNAVLEVYWNPPDGSAWIEVCPEDGTIKTGLD